MRNLVLYFFLLVLRVLFNLASDVVYKCSGFAKTLPEEGLKFVSGRGSGPTMLDPGFMLLPAKVDSIPED